MVNNSTNLNVNNSTNLNKQTILPHPQIIAVCS